MVAGKAKGTTDPPEAMAVRLPPATAAARALTRDLEALLGPGAASCEPADRWAASQDGSPRSLLWTKAGLAPYPPDAVAWPATAEQVQAAVRYAAAERVPLTPVGGGSAGTGAAIPLRGGIALDLKRLAGAPRIDLRARAVEVEAGVNARRLEELLAAAGATLGHFPWGMESATVGGMLATRSGGMRAGRSGKIEDLVLGLEAVDGTGAYLRTEEGPSFGPDLSQLLLGSEGTLAVITRARLRCWPAPTASFSRALRFSSQAAGARVLRELLRSGLRPAALRLYGPLDALLAGLAPAWQGLPAPLRLLLGMGQKEALKLALRAPALLNALADALPAHSLLLFLFEGDGACGEADAAEEGSEALRLCAAMGGEDLGPGPAERWLARRDQGVFAREGVFAAGGFAEVLDVAVTWDRLPALVASVRRALRSRALVVQRVSHAYPDGCAVEIELAAFAGLSTRAARSSRDEAEEDLAEAEGRYDGCVRAALSAAADAGATLSHHRGIGLTRQLLLSREHGEGLRGLRALKAAFDPHAILNPGKLLL
jgi:alkyldihydroxyacetonephosphate synthase